MENLKKNLILDQVRLFIQANPELRIRGSGGSRGLISTICKEFNLNRSSLYYKPKIDTSDDELEIINLIKEIQLEHPCYGAGRISSALKLDYGKVVNIKRVIRIRRKFNLTAVVPKKKQRVRDRNLPDQSTMTPNHYKTTFNEGCLIDRPNLMWVSDFTYLWIPQLREFLYTSTILDVYTKEVLSTKTSFNHNTDLIISTLNEAISSYGIPSYYHSDQGSEYQSLEFRTTLKHHSIIQSFAKKGSPWENGCQESFYGKFKLELLNPSIYVQQVTNNNSSYIDKTSLSQIQEQINQQMFYYNHRRIHTTIKTYPYRRRLEFDMDKSSTLGNLPNSVPNNVLLK